MKNTYQIVKTGQENPPESYARNKKYFKYPLTALFLGDYDPEEAMPQQMLVKVFPDYYEKLCLILPPEFKEIACLIGSGSSSNIKDSNGNLIYNSNSQHAYWLNENVTEENIKKLIEYIKRASILHNYYFLKIFKNGSTGMRYLIDLAVLSSASSRIVFEAKPTCKNGLYQDRPISTIWNTNSQKNLDLSKVFYDHLPDWRPVYEQLKIENKVLIEQTKEVYKKTKIQKLISCGYTQDIATNIVFKEVEDGILSVKTIVEVN